MRKTATFVALAFSAIMGNAQEISNFNGANLSLDKTTKSNIHNNKSSTVSIRETLIGEFEQDPISFMKTYFDVQDFIKQQERQNSDTYEVSFKGKKGELKAKFDKKGKLLATALKFENIFLPSDLRYQLYRDYKGWGMVGNTHVAKESTGITKEDFYKITLKKGKKKLRLKINTTEIGKSPMIAIN